MEPVAFLKYMRWLGFLLGVPSAFFAVWLSRRFTGEWRELVALVVILVVMFLLWLHARGIVVRCPSCKGPIKVKRIYPTIVYRCKMCKHEVDTHMWA